MRAAEASSSTAHCENWVGRLEVSNVAEPPDRKADMASSGSIEASFGKKCWGTKNATHEEPRVALPNREPNKLDLYGLSLNGPQLIKTRPNAPTKTSAC